MMCGMKRGFAVKRMWIALLACLCIAKAGALRDDEGKTLSGMIMTDAYVAEVRLRSNDGEVSGAVIFTTRDGASTWAFDGGFDDVHDYMLKGRSAAHGDALLENLDGSIARGEDGSLALYVRYELPEGMKVVSLSPVDGTADIPLK